MLSPKLIPSYYPRFSLSPAKARQAVVLPHRSHLSVPPSLSRLPLMNHIPLVTPLLISRAITVSFLNPFRRAKAEHDSGQIHLQIKWGRER